MVDDEDRENEGDLIMAAQHATPEKLAFIIRHTSGVICAPMTGARCDDLRLPLMVENNTESHRTRSRTRSTSSRVSAPASPPPTAPPRCGPSPTPRWDSARSPGRATSSPCAP